MVLFKGGIFATDVHHAVIWAVICDGGLCTPQNVPGISRESSVGTTPESSRTAMKTNLAATAATGAL